MKNAVVTGSSSGIGKSISTLLLETGFEVYGISNTPSGIDNPKYIHIKEDLTDQSFFDRLPDLIQTDSIDILVNNAGIAFRLGAMEFNEKDFNRIYDINFKAPILLTQILKSKIMSGMVINISSVGDRIVWEKYGLYSSTKAALDIYFDVMALEEKNIRFLSILPSGVDTPLSRNLAEGDNGFDWDALIKPEQIAKLVGQIVAGEKDLPSGAKIIVVSEAQKDNLNHAEKLWGYNATTEEFMKLNQG